MSTASHVVSLRAEARPTAEDGPHEEVPARGRMTRMIEVLRRNVALVLGPESHLHAGDDSHGLNPDGDPDELW
ncbi:hypothetical protein NE236_20100 [Actinoallomurus purpureus]|uniref:hypothetical protein n=1 Tax=Actinoallomurus purpureus TaxID=478114 RepID=UPI0020931DB5|nr:hypothetical protein [Actinoallomurus purpureus]MCO6007288.1 hypothetical protein [Actinoallomurus purpureus]